VATPARAMPVSTAVMVVVSGLLAAGAEAFLAPSAIAAPLCLSKPLLATRPQGSGMRSTSSRRTELRMGGLLPPVSMDRPGLPKKRAFLWRWSERSLDKFIYLMQVIVVSVYRRVFYKLLVRMNFAEEPDQGSSIRQDLMNDPRYFKASWDQQGAGKSGIFTPTPPSMYRIGTVSEVHSASWSLLSKLNRDLFLHQCFSLRPLHAPPSFLFQTREEGLQAPSISWGRYTERQLNGCGFAQTPIGPGAEAPTISARSAIAFCAPPTR